mmetsp:Transcript_22922/g.73710  ORF Transcript_22922/g.73710 Transcript_22922/m.73710 type:complete len:270 (+) Transcript_22922:981-1790(+)
MALSRGPGRSTTEARPAFAAVRRGPDVVQRLLAVVAAGDEDGAGGDEEGPEELGLDTDGEAVKLARGELIFRHEEDVLGSPVAEPAGEPGEVDAKEEEAAGDEVDDPPSSSVVVVRLGPEGEADGDEGEGRPDPGEPGPLVREVGADALELEELRVELPTRVVVLEQRLRRVALRVRLAHHFDPENRALRDVLRQGHDAPIVVDGEDHRIRRNLHGGLAGHFDRLAARPRKPAHRRPRAALPPHGDRTQTTRHLIEQSENSERERVQAA